MERQNGKKQKNWIDVEEATVVNTVDIDTFKDATVKYALTLQKSHRGAMAVYEYLAALYLANVLTKEQYLDITDTINEELAIDLYTVPCEDEQ